ncbi:uncharacterized protein Pyn_01051 [Prunus yedoensis var. nudiflora]|uniref:Uncharacterized protein n=1 Tax=Prunus yedoensis var. nudiflora TaxID=2094558 RepID=A0A314UEV9_PRUYE|nr:uncharacterized protein Pyn_01051 [Prunus yedoensis var. nudiflora]
MLAWLGYALGQYNPNFWIILHGVYIIGQQGNFGWVQVNCQKAKERGYFIGQPPTPHKTWRNRWFFAFVVAVPKNVTTVEGSPKVVKVDEEKKQQKLRERREREKANRAKKAQAKGAVSTAEGAKGHNVASARRHLETAKDATAEAQAPIRDKNVLQLKVGRLKRELKEVSRRLEATEEVRVEAERKKTEKLAAARAEAVEEYKVYDEFKNLVLDAMVEEQFGWEKLWHTSSHPFS